jgi:hypothetical protein
MYIKSLKKLFRQRMKKLLIATKKYVVPKSSGNRRKHNNMHAINTNEIDKKCRHCTLCIYNLG